MSLQEIAFANIERQLIKKLENTIDPRNENNFSSIKKLVKQTRNVKKLTRNEFKKICKIAKDLPLTRLTRAWKKEMRYKMKAIRFDLRLIIDYVLTEQMNLKKIEDRYLIRNLIIKNINEDYGDD